MDGHDWRGDYQESDDASSQMMRSYNFLLQMSRRLGGVAAKSSQLDDAIPFLEKNNHTKHISPEWIFGNVITRIKSPEHPEPTRQHDINDLQKIVARSHEVLMSSNTVFPISLFPDTVTVDRTKITITRRNFFWTSDVMSIRIEDILNVSASCGPLFGSLTVASRIMSTVDHFQINHFWRNDAIRLKHIIQGYVIAQHNKIDTAHLDKKDLIATLIELGQDSNR